MTKRSRRWLPALLGAAVAATAGMTVANTPQSRPVSSSSGAGATRATLLRANASTASSQVAYISDATSGGSNLFSDDMGAPSPGGGATGSSGSYSTASPAGALTVTVTNQDASFLGSATYPLSAYDTVIMYDVCDVASFPQYMTNLNKFVDNGGKLVILDGGQCVNGNGGVANWSTFEKGFSDKYQLPDPQYGPSLPYTSVESGDPLTTALPDCTGTPCNEAGNAVSDASVIKVASSGWCQSLGGTDTNGVSGAVEAYTHNTAGSGLIVYEGEPFALSSGTHPSQKHLRLVFDGILGQPWNTDSLPCHTPLAGTGGQTQPSTYTPVTPFRVWDTRASSQVQCPGGCTLGPSATHTVQITGMGSPAIPANASAVVVNLTGIQPSANTYMSVAPTGAAGLGSSSNLNLVPGAIQANLVTVALSSSGQVSVYNLAGTIDSAMDVMGYFLPATAPPPAHTIGTFHPISPMRACDSRTTSPCGPAAALGAGQSRAVNVTSASGGIPSDGTPAAAAFNLTGVQGTANTYLTAFPPNADGTCGTPSTSNLNLNAGAILPNRVIVPIGTSGAAKGLVCIFNLAGTVNFIIDTNGWFGTGGETTPGALFYPVTPQRICDTRSGSGTQCTGQTLSSNSTLVVTGNVPAAPPSAVAIVVNATGIQGSGDTFLSLYPDGPQPNPMTSDLNLRAGQIVPNLSIVALSGGKLDVYNLQGQIDVALDAEGWFA